MKKPQVHTILVVDDDNSILRFLEKRLVSWNYRVMIAENGRQGIMLVQSDRPNVVITDLFMSDGDGFELLAHARKTLPELPVIVMSGQGEMDDVIQALRMGAWDYICKPIEKMAFIKMAIKNMLGKAQLIKENQYYSEHLEDLVKQKSTELERSERHYKTVADYTYDWEYWIGPDRKIVYISPSCERITGYPHHEFVENPSKLNDIIHPEDRATFIQHLNDSYFHKEICHLDFRIVRRDGGKRWIGHSCQPVFDTQGNFLGCRCSNRDITYQKTIENDLIAQRQVLMEKTITQTKANEALKTILDQREIEKKAIEQSMVANLKRFVFPYLEELEQKKVGEEAMTYANIIRDNIEQLILPVSKNLSTAYLDLTPTEIKVTDLIRQGKPTKSIAAILNTSISTVEKHRNKIRKKLNILNKKTNLHTHLNSLT